MSAYLFMGMPKLGTEGIVIGTLNRGIGGIMVTSMVWGLGFGGYPWIFRVRVSNRVKVCIRVSVRIRVRGWAWGWAYS